MFPICSCLPAYRQKRLYLPDDVKCKCRLTSYAPNLHDFSPAIQEEIFVQHKRSEDDINLAVIQDGEVTCLKNVIVPLQFPEKNLSKAFEPRIINPSIVRAIRKIEEEKLGHSPNVHMISATTHNPIDKLDPIRHEGRDPNDYYFHNGKMISIDPKDKPHLLPKEKIVGVYKDIHCVTEHISEEAIKGTLVITNFKIHFLANAVNSSSDLAYSFMKSPAGRKIILDMPLGFVNKINEKSDPHRIKVDCKDMRHFTLLLGEKRQETQIIDFQSILDLEISNPLMTLFVEIIFSCVLPKKEKMAAKHRRSGSLDLSPQSNNSKFYDKPSNKLNKSLDDLVKKTGLDNSFAIDSFAKGNFEQNLMDDLRAKLLKQGPASNE